MRYPWLAVGHQCLCAGVRRGFGDVHWRLGIVNGAYGDFARMGDELARAIFPGVPQREFAAGFPRNPERLHASDAKIIVEHTNWIVGDNITRAGDRESGDGNAARQRLELHDAECVGDTWKYKNVGRREVCGENSVVELAEEFCAGKATLEFGFLRPGADDDLGAGQIERKESGQVFFDSDAADAHEDRPRKIEVDSAVGMEQVDVDATRPHPEIGEASPRQLLHKRGSGHHGYGRGGMKSPQDAVDPLSGNW